MATGHNIVQDVCVTPERVRNVLCTFSLRHVCQGSINCITPEK